jgi:hypothetical protein
VRASNLIGGAALLASTIAALAAAPGYWALSRASDGVKAGVVFPDFSTDEFVGMALRCPPGAATVVVSLDSKVGLPSDAKARVTLAADDTHAALDGRAERSAMDDQTRIIVNLALSDPILAALSNAERIAYAINGVAEPLPTKNSRTVLADFLSACGVRPAADQAIVDVDDQAPAPAAASEPTLDEPQLGFAVRVPQGWEIERSDENGIKTWKLRNSEWVKGKIPAGALVATVSVVARNPGSNPEKEFRAFAQEYAVKLLHGGRVTDFAPNAMGGLSGFIAHVTGTVPQNQGQSVAVEGVIILTEPAGQYVIASTVAPTASAAVLGSFGAAGGLFGPHEDKTQTSPTPTAPEAVGIEQARAASRKLALYLKTRSADDWRAAVAASKQATTAAPESSEGWRALGVAYARAPKEAAVDPQLAQAALARAIALAPDDAGARMVLAGVLAAQKAYGPAIAQIQNAIELKPDLATSAVLADMAGLHAKNGDPELGLAFLAAYAKRHPGVGSTQIAQAILLRAAGRASEALMLARKIAVDPASVPADAERARALLSAWL